MTGRYACFNLVFVGFHVGLSCAVAETPVALDIRDKTPQFSTAPPATLRVDSPLVLIPAHVTTAAGASVTSLNQENFQLLEDRVVQTIAHFSKEDAPVSIGLLLDASGSMRPKMRKASEAAASFFKTANREDEFFLVEFNDRVKLAVPFTSDSGDVYDEIVRAKPFGKTALLDAIYLALREMKHARNSRKAIVILSDGGDNWSRHSAREIRNALLESDVQLYAMGIFDFDALENATREEREGPRLLDDLAELSGGKHYPVRNIKDLPEISANVGNDLRNEYLLGYYPANFTRDGKYHQVQMKLVVSDVLPNLHTYYRRGYYAPNR